MLSNRKHCLECSPFGRHNTKKILDPNVAANADVFPAGERDCRDCIVCGRRFTPSRSKGHLANKCNTCVVHRFREAVKARAIAYKGGQCALCGYDKCSAALHFHHLDTTQKDFAIGGNHTRAWNKIQTELDKCILVCANCHAEIHAKRAPLVQRLVQ